MDDVRRVAALERGDQLVVHRVPVALDVLDLDVRVRGVPLGDEILVGRSDSFCQARLRKRSLTGPVDGLVVAAARRTR